MEYVIYFRLEYVLDGDYVLCFTKLYVVLPKSIYIWFEILNFVVMHPWLKNFLSSLA